MKFTMIVLATVLVASNTSVFAQVGSVTAGSAAASGSTVGSSVNAATGGMGDLGNSAGSIAAGANSVLDPSGNSFINTSPSGSTLAPIPNAPALGFGRR